jgi:hypothetical protein
MTPNGARALATSAETLGSQPADALSAENAQAVRLSRRQASLSAV